jgi:hypothetical protein
MRNGGTNPDGFDDKKKSEGFPQPFLIPHSSLLILQYNEGERKNDHE